MGDNDRSFRYLRKLGLTTNQAKIYLTLLESGPLNAKQLSLFSGVPESKIYQVLNRLEEINWIKVTRGRPNLFKANSPAEVIKALKLKKISEMDRLEKEILQELEPIFIRQSEAEKPDIWILRGRERVLLKLSEMITKAETKILMAIPFTSSEILNLIIPTLQTAKLRGVKIVSVIPKSTKKEERERISKVSDLISTDQFFGGGIIIDEKEVLIILFNPVLGIWSDHIGLAQIATGYFNYSYGI